MLIRLPLVIVLSLKNGMPYILIHCALGLSIARLDAKEKDYFSKKMKKVIAVRPLHQSYNRHSLSDGKSTIRFRFGCVINMDTDMFGVHDFARHQVVYPDEVAASLRPLCLLFWWKILVREAITEDC